MQKGKGFEPEQIRNVVLLGHGGAGKTTLAEAVLHQCGVITRMGVVGEASTVSDFEPEAKAHQHSTSSTLLFADHEGREINLIDTPGHPELVGAPLSAIPAVETAIVVVSAVTGIELNTRRLFHAAGEAGLARMVVINKIDLNPEGLVPLVAELKQTFGKRLHCMNLPTAGGTDVIDCFDRESGASDIFSVEDEHQEILESTVEIDDTQLERYLEGEPLDLAELRRTFVKAMVKGQVVPILFASAKNEVGVADLLHILVEEAPSPLSGRPRRVREKGELVELACDPEKPFLGHVFKVVIDPYLGMLSMVRVLQGTLEANTPFVVGDETKVRKPGHVLKIEGRDHPELEAVAYAGDLVAVARMDDLHVGQILRAPELHAEWKAVAPKLPEPMVSLAIEAANRTDEVKLGGALDKLREEDPTFRAKHDEVTKELVVSGVGEMHVRLMLERLANRFKLEVAVKKPTVAYRETITRRAEGHYRHKKQTGGAGQFAEVFLRIEPLARGEGFEFANEVFGGAIPTQFIPAVEKGVQDALEAGPLAGFPVHDVRVVVTDGKSHSVDSKDIAFRTAGKKAVRDAFAKAGPTLLEPIVSLEITTPASSLGQVMGDLKSLSARVFAVEPLSGERNLVRAQAPLADLTDLGQRLRNSTSGRGTYVLEPSHYDFASDQTQAAMAAAAKRPQDDDD
ncbi:MAG: elongation factor G [Myxococcales bacterium]|nr:elongation factor G [Myxococcales bacterium]